MHLTTKQRDTLKHLLAYVDHIPNHQAVELYFKYTDAGDKPQHGSPGWAGYCELMLAHKLASGLQNEMWLDGLLAEEHYSLTQIVLEGLRTPTTRKLPALYDALKLWLNVNHSIVVSVDEIEVAVGQMPHGDERAVQEWLYSLVERLK